MIKLTKSQLKEIIKEELQNEANVSSQPYRAWSEHGDNIEKLFNDAHWAVKAFPNKKKEAKEIQKLSKKLNNLIAIIRGQAMDL